MSQCGIQIVEDSSFKEKSRNQLETEILDLTAKVKQAEKSLREVEERIRRQTSQTNCLFMSMRHRIRNQEGIINELRQQQESLIQHVLMNLLSLEAGLKKEQKEIFCILKEKDQIIQQQARDLQAYYSDDTHDSGIEMQIQPKIEYSTTELKVPNGRLNSSDKELEFEDSEAEHYPKQRHLYGSYERLTELGIKTAMECYNRLFSNHRSVTKPRDIKRRLTRHTANRQKMILELQV